MKKVVMFINKANRGKHVIPFRKRCLNANTSGMYHRRTHTEIDMDEVFNEKLRADLAMSIAGLNATLDYSLPEGFGSKRNPV